MKKSLLLLLVLTLIFSTFCSVTVLADTTVTRVSLEQNKSFYSSKITEPTKLIVKGYNDEGTVVATYTGAEGVTYESTCPWVFDIEDDGTITDYGYDGTTIVTAKVTGVGEASLVMIKASDNGKTATRGFENNITSVPVTAVADMPYHIEAPGNGFVEKTSGGHDGKTYLQAKNGSAGYAYKGSWDNAANIRVAQVWFYDSGIKSNVTARLGVYTPNPATAYTSGSAPVYLENGKRLV